MTVVLAQTIKMLMEERGLTPEQLAEISGVRRTTLSDWLAGTSPRNLEDARRVARNLGVTLHYLLFGQDEQDVLALLRTVPTTLVLEGVYRVRLERIETTEVLT